jgi:hypothetical protein
VDRPSQGDVSVTIKWIDVSEGDLSSANGAFHFSLGQRPRDSHNIKLLALKARFIPTNLRGISAINVTESRFQRLVMKRSES